jgi:hypothetical protein
MEDNVTSFAGSLFTVYLIYTEKEQGLAILTMSSVIRWKEEE